ncbi:hypothetical protein Bca52824_038314 [Brassica carinata]|uniref:Lactate/malate dehydrogenase C-terminal domain-containing protein n=1 Tax=Brassica carinata TaxID=52824 RepID=A0A8X7UTK8_BRACI|nr:hypothetical protein Bca52824_038314 [Brassica carinata]
MTVSLSIYIYYIKKTRLSSQSFTSLNRVQFRTSLSSLLIEKWPLYHHRRSASAGFLGGQQCEERRLLLLELGNSWESPCLMPLVELILLWHALINTHSLLSLGFDKLVNAMVFYGLKQAEVMSHNPREVVVPVVGGHARVTILPLLSQVKPPCSFTQKEIEYVTDRMENGGIEVVKFADACLKGLRGDANIVECAFVATHVTELPFFASKLRLGRCGVNEVYSLGPFNEYERMGLEKAKKELERVL